MVESSDKTWSTGEGTGKPLQYPCLGNPMNSMKINTKIMMLFFYTIFHGLMMFLAGVPFFFYKLTGKTKEDIHNEVIAKREAMSK